MPLLETPLFWILAAVALVLLLAAAMVWLIRRNTRLQKMETDALIRQLRNLHAELAAGEVERARLQRIIDRHKTTLNTAA